MIFTTDKSFYLVGDIIEYSFTNGSTDPGAWIALFDHYFYTGSGTNAITGPGAESGSYTIGTATRAPGVWKFYYYPANDYENEIAAKFILHPGTATLTLDKPFYEAGDQVVVNFEDIEVNPIRNSGAWYALTKKDKQYKDGHHGWGSVGHGDSTGTFTISTAGLEPGEYYPSGTHNYDGHYTIGGLEHFTLYAEGEGPVEPEPVEDNLGMTYRGSQMRNSFNGLDKQGIRFVFDNVLEVGDTFDSDEVNYTVLERGALMAAASRFDEEDVYEDLMKLDGEGNTLASFIKSDNDLAKYLDEEVTYYASYVYNIPEEGIDVEFVTRLYIKATDGENVVYFYSDVATRTVRDVYDAGAHADITDDGVHAWFVAAI